MAVALAKPVSGSILQPGHPLARDLDAYWAMIEGGGQVLHNAAGVQYAATASGPPTWEPCSRFPGPALRFDGTDDYYNFGNVLAIHYNDVSMMALVKLDAAQVESYNAIAGRGILNGAGKGGGFYVVKSSNNLVFSIRNGSSTVALVGKTSLLNTGWHVAIGTVDRDSATGVQFYIDGVLQGTGDPTAFATADLYASTDRFSIGSSWISYNSAFLWDFRGVIAAVAQWHRALTEAEVAELTRDPFCVLRRSSSRAWLGAMSAGGTHHAVSGSVAAAASISGGLAVVALLVGSSPAQTQMTAAVAVARSLAGSASPQSTSAGVVSVARGLAGSSAIQSAVSGAVRVSRPLAGQITAPSQASASAAVARSLAGQSASQSSLSGALSSQGQTSLSGETAAAVSVFGALSVARPMAGDVTAVVDVGAFLARSVGLSGGLSTTTSLSAVETMARPLSGRIEASVTMSASAGAARSLSGSLQDTASLSGSLFAPGGVSLASIFILLAKRR